MRIILTLLLLFTSACGSNLKAVEKSAENSLLQTEILNPQPIKITVEKLPNPFNTSSASRPPQVVPVPAKPTLKVPRGFKVNVFAQGLDSPRWLALTPTGDVLVTETPKNRITLLRDTNRDGIADSKKVFAEASNGLDIPFGMAFTQNNFFLGNHNAVGSRSNADEEPLPRASVQVLKLNTSKLETFAFGLRNPVGLDFHPTTGELYTTVNERDGLGDDLVPDYLTRIRSGEFYGWPYAYLTPNRLDPRQIINNTQSTNPKLATLTKTPDVLFQAHSAALGLKFYTGKTFPKKYHAGAFVAFRGSWNRNQGTGYKVVFVPFNAQGRPSGYYEEFLSGFLLDPSVPKTWGRPVGLLVLPDGSLLITEEGNGRIYRVQYNK